MRAIKQQYSIKHYNECRLNLKKAFDKRLSKEIMAFSGWNLFGAISAMSITQVRSILLNMFFGVQINASEGIAKTASNAVNMVSVNLTQAINPQLVKSEGSGDRQRCCELQACQQIFNFLFSLIAIPVIIEMPYLLIYGLKYEFAVIFARLTLIALLIEKFTFEITNAIRAVGKIKQFQIVETLIKVLNIPIAYLLFKFGYASQTIYVVGIFFSCIAAIGRLYCGKMIADMDISEYIKQGILPTFLPILIAIVVGYVIHLFVIEGVIKLILSFVIIVGAALISIRYLGLTKSELNMIKNMISSLKLKFALGRVK